MGIFLRGRGVLYLERFHDPKTEAQRAEAAKAGRKAFIPPETEAQRALWQVVRAQLAFLHQREGGDTVTLDLDATLVETFKQAALFCYKGYRAYQPLNVFWHELEMVVHSEFRDGNVPAGFGLVAVLERALEQLPEGVKQGHAALDRSRPRARRRHVQRDDAPAGFPGEAPRIRMAPEPAPVGVLDRRVVLRRVLAALGTEGDSENGRLAEPVNENETPAGRIYCSA
ncbi:MAG: transposase, partial [Myxococcota bacterium]|nr:transposase [Myxococcota bacterium]